MFSTYKNVAMDPMMQEKQRYTPLDSVINSMRSPMVFGSDLGATMKPAYVPCYTSNIKPAHVSSFGNEHALGLGYPFTNASAQFGGYPTGLGVPSTSMPAYCSIPTSTSLPAYGSIPTSTTLPAYCSIPASTALPAHCGISSPLRSARQVYGIPSAPGEFQRADWVNQCHFESDPLKTNILKGLTMDRFKELKADTWIDDSLTLLRGIRQTDKIWNSLASGENVASHLVARAIQLDRCVDARMADFIEKILDHRRRNSEKVDLSEHLLTGRDYYLAPNALCQKMGSIAEDVFSQEFKSMVDLTV
jgi:hypothetical protein